MSQQTPERRQYKRHPITCPVRLVDESGAKLATGKTVNVSDGGILVPVAAGAAPEQGGRLAVTLSIPRSTPNTFMMQPVVGNGVIVRNDPADDGECNVAVRFAAPLDLDLEI